MDNLILLGCCGAYCKTCKGFKEQTCKGCKVGYAAKERDIQKAKCKIKVCCITKRLDSCADCNEYELCNDIQSFLNHNGYKYSKYKEAILYIRKNGYKSFFKIANNWKMQYGKYL